MGVKDWIKDSYRYYPKTTVSVGLILSYIASFLATIGFDLANEQYIKFINKDNQKQIHRTFQLKNKKFSFSVPDKLYQVFKNKPNNGSDNLKAKIFPFIYQIYGGIRNSVMPEYIDDLTLELTKDYQTKEEKARVIADFIHSIPYGDKNQNYTKNGIETIVEGSDCDGRSYLAQYMFKKIGLDSIAIMLNLEDYKMGHMAVGVEGNFEGYIHNYNGKEYFHFETIWEPEKLKEPPKIGQTLCDHKDFKKFDINYFE